MLSLFCLLNTTAARGNFAFSMSETQLPAHDQCDAAVLLSTDGSSVAGSTMSATRSFPLDVSCGNVILNSAGVWYTVQGTGNSLSATTCSATLDFASKISLFEGSSCDDIVCLDTANKNDRWRCLDAPSEASASTINWKSEADKTYYLYVHGGMPSSIGNFELSVSELPQTVENNFCPQALNISSSEQISGSTTEAAIGHFGAGYCGGSTENGGIWYNLEGTGGLIEMTGCSSGDDDYQMTVSVFEGSCSNLTCLTGETFPISCSEFIPTEPANRLLQPLEEQLGLTWLSEAGVSYKIYVHGQAPNFTLEGGTGSFELVIETISTEEPTALPTFSQVLPETFPPASTESPTKSPTTGPTLTLPTDFPTIVIPVIDNNTDNPDSYAISRLQGSILLVLASAMGSLSLLFFV
jgi:hypothetical protein